MILIGGMLITPLVLIMLPSGFFDQGESICPSKLLFGVECPGCGMTRATMHMLHFEFHEAWAFNRLSVVLVPLLLFFYFSILVRFIRRVRNNGEKLPREKQQAVK